MTEDERPRNQISGSVEGTAFQVGSVHGDVVFRQSSTSLNEGGPQAVLARQLADQVRMLSRREEENWRIADPLPLPVRWRTADEELFDHWDNVNGRSGSEPVSLAGHFAEIRETYESVPSGRLVILGRAGAGKTVFAHRLILSLIGDGDRSGPVPVLFSISGWNATSTALRTWMVHQLVRDFPFLDAADRTGKNGAETLVDGDGILPVLDGFDEIPAQHHPDAIREISRFDGPLVVTSRPDEYTGAALAAKVLSRAAAIHLEDLTLDDAERYLVASTAKTRTAEWEAVFAHLRAAPDELASRNLAPVMATPLMVMLARTTYNDTAAHDPAELLDTHRFPTREDVEEHLLSAYLDAVYDPRFFNPHTTELPDWDPNRARHWLGFLAAHLTRLDTYDLTWWRLDTGIHSVTRALIITFLFVWSAWFLGILMSPLVASDFSVFSGVPSALFLGLPTGIIAGFVNVLGRPRQEPERFGLRIRVRGVREGVTFAGFKRAGSEVFIGAIFGVSAGITAELVFAISGLIEFGTWRAGDIVRYGWVGLSGGLVFGLVNLVVLLFGDRYNPEKSVTAWQLLITDRAVTLLRVIAAAIAVGGVVGFALFHEPQTLADHIFIGSLAGAAVGVVRLLGSAWGNWLIFTRFWLPLTRRSPWRPKRFLEDAHRRSVLRQAGAVYQFRHARLRDHLARQHQR
ncbi:NACHT domain-containing protein [Saccharopolyspora endophytica]|uniref:NACHT domain-containing protein n=1 Tax=Saccharopolyspora endophytica TaxID=543886 RepID=A0ABS5DFH5_9PSEU|nr:NACHT domain-containing protein [Saccharopolyspora endophytica]MBQ0925037.1 NACHT domain-containing protein [Saccharopolyspora endophytica]